MSLQIWGLALALALGLEACATTRYKEVRSPPESDGEQASFPSVDTTVVSEAQALEAKVQSLELRLIEFEAQLRTLLDQQDSANGAVMGRFSALADEILELRRQIQGAATLPLKTAASAGQGPAASTLPSKGVNVLYDRALQAFDLQDYAGAKRLSAQILEQEPQGQLADNAQYWLGECAYAVEDYTGGLDAFKRVFGFAETEKDDDAQLKLGYCYFKLGDAESALIEFKRLTVDYPQSEYIQRAEEQIRRIRAAKASRP